MVKRAHSVDFSSSFDASHYKNTMHIVDHLPPDQTPDPAYGSVTFANGRLFDGVRLLERQVACFEDGRIVYVGPADAAPKTVQQTDLNNDILFPGFVDLQVNGGGGVLFNDDPCVASLRRMSEAHRNLGVTALLPTLITDTADKTRAAVEAVVEAIHAGVPGIAGLHLEGPHLSLVRKGAHDAALIRPMDGDDLDMLLQAAGRLPVLKVTVAPENTTIDQVTRLSRAGVLLSLGHSDADFATCSRYFAAGARCATHLFNAMSQLGSREPGLAGAALAHGSVAAGLIADAVHVHPATIRTAWRAKTGPGRIFLVSDAMAVAGTNQTTFDLGGRQVLRRNGALTLADGTLAGADLDLATAIRVMTQKVGVPLLEALKAATSGPSRVIGRPYGFGTLSDVVRLRTDSGG